MTEKEAIKSIDIIFTKITELKNKRMIERKEWRKFGKALNAENIIYIDKLISTYEHNARHIKLYAEQNDFKIPVKYNFTYFSILEDKENFCSRFKK
jgi:hypothetical protein